VSDAADQQGAGATARLFVALPVPGPVRRHLERVQQLLRGGAPELRFTRSDGVHVTLAFLGDVDVGRLDEVGDVVAAAAAGEGPISLELGEPGRFGNRVLWIEVADDPAGAVAALGERIQVAITATGLPIQRQPVRPHLTLARGGRGRPVRDRYLADLRAVLGEVEVTDPRWVADEVQVWRSELGRGPARYHVETSVPLEG
jgi:RNA 2',3'-cyclic 3'-phosphodiesterase